jgi:transposase
MALFRLSDEAWAAIEPHLPRNQPGARRVDDWTGDLRRPSRAEGRLPLVRLPDRLRTVPRRRPCHRLAFWL